MFYQIFLLSQENETVCISNKRDTYELSHKLLIKLRVRILEVRKYQNDDDYQVDPLWHHRFFLKFPFMAVDFPNKD